MKLFFISKWANWQKYRLDVLTKLSAAHNYQTEILTTGTIKSYLSDNDFVKYKIFTSIFPQSSKFSFMPGILRYIMLNKPDAILCVNNSTQLTEYFSLILCKVLKIKFIWWTHGFDHGKTNLPFLIKAIKEKYVLFFLKRANSIIVFSELGKEYLISKNIPEKKIYIANNTLDTDKIIKQKNKLLLEYDYNRILKNLRLNETDKIVIFSGQLNKNKKVANAINAFELVIKKIPQAKLVIIGNGMEYENLQQLAKVKIPNHSIFLGELFDDEELSKWFTVAQLFLMPGYVGLAIIHAFCFGLPLITEDLSYHSPEIQFLHNGKNGYKVNEDDINEIANKIIELLMDKEKRKSFSSAAYSVVQNHGNIQSMIKEMNKAINE